MSTEASSFSGSGVSDFRLERSIFRRCPNAALLTASSDARTAGDGRSAAGRDVLFDIDWQGAQQLREAAGDDMVGIFILPPSTDELAARLRTRAQDSEETVRYRLAQIANDVTHWPEYDYVLINQDLANSVSAVRAILAAERLRRVRQPGLGEFVKQFRGSAS